MPALALRLPSTSTPSPHSSCSLPCAGRVPRSTQQVQQWLVVTKGQASVLLHINGLELDPAGPSFLLLAGDSVRWAQGRAQG